MQAALHTIATVVMGMTLIWAAVASVRWAKRHSTGAEFLAGALLLVLGFAAPIPKRPQQGVEEARIDKGRKGAESGDPPAD